MTDFRFTVTEADAPRMLEWLKSRGGIALWVSVDLGYDPGAQSATPANTEDGKPYPKPHWKFAEKPEQILTDPALIKVVRYKEVKRFHVGVKPGGSFGQFVLTDGATRKVRDAVAKAGEDATYEFDYGEQDAVILVPERSRSLADWANEQNQVAANG